MKKEKNTTPSGEDYLEAILILQRQKGLVRPVDIARHMEFSKPSITHAITTLQRGGFVEKDKEGFIRLTDIGREQSVPMKNTAFSPNCWWMQV